MLLAASALKFKFLFQIDVDFEWIESIRFQLQFNFYPVRVRLNMNEGFLMGFLADSLMVFQRCQLKTRLVACENTVIRATLLFASSSGNILL